MAGSNEKGGELRMLAQQESRHSALQNEAELVQSQHPLSQKDEKDLEVNAVADDEILREDDSGLPFSKARCIALVITVTLAAILNTLGVQASVIILPTIGHHLNIPESRQQWIVSAYNLTFGCFLLLWGRLADVYGKRLIFLWGSVWITVTSIIVPFMPNEIGFDAFRGLQGLGAAAMVPTALGILGTTFKPGKAKNYAFSCYGGGAPLGGALGNVIGGVVAAYLDWRWVFWIFAILGALITVAGYFVIPLPPLQEEPISMRHNVDWVGGTLVTTSILILLFALTEGNVVGWSTPWVPTLIAVSFVILAAFVVWCHWLEKRGHRPPLMKVSIFKNIPFSAANIIMLLFFASFNNFLITATYWFQSYQGLSIIQTTLRFIPNGITGVTVAFICAHLLARVRGDFILTFGTIAISLSSILFAIPIPTDTTYWAWAFPALVLSISGADTLFPILTLFVAKTLPAEDQALGGALINAVGQVGRAIGLAITTAIQTAIIAKERGVSVQEVGDGFGSEPGDEALKLGLRGASWFNASIGVMALVVVLLFFRGAGKVGKH
ncbi:drug resistance protein [Aaosphaeria arxii CBS 175.79]|uniref:Drug resistance protein n=1 Tax=Aaosphaeria arxii CBS 175.79 TaxID=1450172 RepID=A0A6A5Y7Z9_9PLEO|nr:drug resistance protein [Aaosphaeria arxii CBS 175.79]KAF2020930.1 drug resistance protein [Aaosphaeria arxii CBS 175.79]